ncbi:HNH endonuclease [Burkholderia cepacia]|uniref:HNH endonuclease n=1 Tax=Burkholderia cepacia TaxID=292 RepID=UPI0009BF3262|nr:HNH endonuclease [Burkholderia cepacia]
MTVDITNSVWAVSPAARSSSRVAVHHRRRLADGDEDTVENAIALCHNCHHERHYGINYASDAAK